MACGVPVIATNWSGVTAYLSEENGYPLAVEALVEARYAQRKCVVGRK
jgi:glycosyltransferase involved in cell wall biosynthesis